MRRSCASSHEDKRGGRVGVGCPFGESIRKLIMQKKLFEAVLGIVDPWRVTGIHFDVARKALTISIGFVKGSRFTVQRMRAKKGEGQSIAHSSFVSEVDLYVSIHAHDRATTTFGRGYAPSERDYPPEGGGFQPGSVFDKEGAGSVRLRDYPVIAEQAAPLDPKLARWLEKGKKKISQVVDPETGEPLVVERGKSTDFCS
jgi:hypothetical protein